ncbi:MAG: HlyD family type I secretion periplasmic adaptor subunit [Sphingobium sp.]|uniref:HlyD family type I secretion periplasmic adaptor subunit n=1 Tax=Sphingobium sp. TaxID=1912891 RepID=UPI0029BDB777|nr:HlyD family type I secretion periplasmic adaptor subunit [Sphingobium sp.]MDX3908283.1 HlyD family type I secretion periplasmic adaptor subunit [Sphingobium sp.]
MTDQMVTLARPAQLPAVYESEERINGSLKTAVLMMAVLVFGIGGAAAFIPFGGAIVGSGQLGVESRVKQITHPTGGVVAEILVENGQHVRKGQLLMRLDDKVLGTDAQLSALSLDQMVAQRARLEAERMGASAIRFPDALLKRTDASARGAMADEQKLFDIRRSEGAGLTAQLHSRIGQYGQEIAGYRAQINALQKQATLIKPELAGVRELYGKKLVTLNRVNQLERTSADIGGSVGALNAQIAQTMARISETRQQIIQLNETRRSDAGVQLAQINTALNQQQVRSVSATDAQSRTMIRAPYNGVVDKLAATTIGGVIRPADTIMEIVPDQDKLLVEGAISPQDIDRIHTGQPARIRLTSANATATPELHGKVVFVAAERTVEPSTQRSYFPVRVELDPREVAATTGIKMKAGMPAEIFVESGSRTMLSYLTKPLRDQIQRAFRDN